MKKVIVAFFLLCTPLLATGQQSPVDANQPSHTTPSLTYNQLIATGYDLLKEARIGEAYLAAMEAAKKNASRFEAYTLAALSLHVRGDDREAKPLIDKALLLVPAAKKPLVNNLAIEIKNGLSTAAKSDPEMRRKLDVLRLILDDADKAQGNARLDFLKEFLDKSKPLIAQNPDDAQMWILRAAASVESNALSNSLNLATTFMTPGTQAGCNLLRLGQDKSENKTVQRLLATMDRKGWILPKDFQVQPLLTEFNGVLQQMGAVRGTNYDKDVDGSTYRERSVSYGDLQGTCDSGFYFQINETGKAKFYSKTPDSLSYEVNSTLTGIYYFDIANDEFAAVSLENPASVLKDTWFASPYSVRDKKSHTITTYSNATPTAKDSEPADYDFTLAATLSTMNKLPELLNKIHLACLCEHR